MSDISKQKLSSKDSVPWHLHIFEFVFSIGPDLGEDCSLLYDRKEESLKGWRKEAPPARQTSARKILSVKWAGEILLAKVPLRIYALNETWRTRWSEVGCRVVRSEIYERPVLEHSKETARKLGMDFSRTVRGKNADWFSGWTGLSARENASAAWISI